MLLFKFEPACVPIAPVTKLRAPWVWSFQRYSANTMKPGAIGEAAGDVDRSGFQLGYATEVRVALLPVLLAHDTHRERPSHVFRAGQDADQWCAPFRL